MFWFNRILERHRHPPCTETLSPRGRRRMRGACRELSAMEERVQREMGLPIPPRLALVDEEMAAVVPWSLREDIECGGG